MGKAKGGSQYETYGKTHYQRNKAKYIAGAIARRQRNKEFVVKLRKDGKCVDCGISDWRVLDFDHVRGSKTENVSIAAWKGWSIEKIEKEIAKCELRCSNCHRIRTMISLGHEE